MFLPSFSSVTAVVPLSTNLNQRMTCEVRKGNHPKSNLLVSPPAPRAVGDAAVGGQRHIGMPISLLENQSSQPRSCVSSEESLKHSSSPETTSTVLVGCPRCLMYDMLYEANSRCPTCKSTILFDFLHNHNHNLQS